VLERPKRNGNHTDRRDFIGGSDARVIMGQDEKALIRLWQEKRGEIGPEDLSGNLIVQLGLVTEDLNRQCYERNTGNAIKDIQCRVKHPVIRWMAATLDGVVARTEAVYEGKFMLPWSFSEEFAAEKYMAQLQHNMWVTNARMAALSIITGGGKWVEISIARSCANDPAPPGVYNTPSRVRRGATSLLLSQKVAVSAL
jgi:putative phage-type endonuclease